MVPETAVVPPKKRRARIPLVLRKTILKLVNESELQLEDLSTRIYNHLKVFFLPGEAVQLIGAKQNGNIIKGSVIKRIDNKKGPPTNTSTSAETDMPPEYSYNVKIIEKKEVVTAIPCSYLRRLPCTPSTNVLQAFIQANAKFEENSSRRFHWVLNNKISIKPRKINSALTNGLSEQKKNIKPAFTLHEKRKSDSDSANPKKSNKIKKTLLKSDTLQPALKKQKMEKPAKSPKSGVPPIWAKLLKSFPLDPEVVLVRLEDGNEGANGSFASPQKCALTEKSTSTVSGKENKAKSSPNKKMKQMTLFDMTKKLVSPSESRSNNCSVKIEKVENSFIQAVIGNASSSERKLDDAKCGLVVGMSDKKKIEPLNVKKMHKGSVKMLENAIRDVSKKIAAAEADKFQKSNSSTVSSKSPVDDSLCVKISFSAFTTKIHSDQEKAVSMKSTSQGTLDGILKKAIEIPKLQTSKHRGRTVLWHNNHIQMDVPRVKNIKPLPPPVPLKTPPGFENSWFGDVAMIIQFVNSFRNILQPDKSISLSTALLMEALMKGPGGFLYLNNILVCLLKTLFQGCSAEDYEEAGVSLSEVPITIYSASELTRLCFRENEDDECSVFSSKQLDSLSSKELHQLDPHDKIQIISHLCSNVLTCYTVGNYVNEIQKTLTKLRGENLQAAIEKNKIKRMLTEEKNPNIDEVDQNEGKLTAEQKLNPGSFYGPLAVNNSIEEGSTMGEVQNGFTSRRHSLQIAKQEKQKAEKLKREKAEELKRLKVEEDFQKNLAFHVNEIKSLRDLRPLGKDRNMSRYWWFSHFTPQLVIENGWWEEMDEANKKAEDSESRLTPKKAKLDTISCQRENRWFVYETAEEVNALLACLSKEDDEKNLQSTLKKYLPNFTATSSKTMLKDENEEPSNGDLELTEAFRDEILELHHKIMEGALGDMGKSEKWFACVDNANTCQDFGQCLLTLQNCVYPKFFCGAFGSINTKTGKENKKKSDNLATWQDMIKTCQTMSRLHVLLGLLSACIQWDKSSAKTKCKVCRKNSDDTLLLCDKCSKGFHLGCLRPRLRNVPRNDWFCPSCKKSMEEIEKEESSEEEKDGEECSEEEEEDAISAMNKKVICVKCKRKGDKRLMCAKCYKGWHPACHNPPMRNTSRSPWFCRNCRGSLGRRVTRSNQGIRLTPRNK